MLRGEVVEFASLNWLRALRRRVCVDERWGRRLVVVRFCVWEPVCRGTGTRLIVPPSSAEAGAHAIAQRVRRKDRAFWLVRRRSCWAGAADLWTRSGWWWWRHRRRLGATGSHRRRAGVKCRRLQRVWQLRKQQAAEDISHSRAQRGVHACNAIFDDAKQLDRRCNGTLVDDVSGHQATER